MRRIRRRRQRGRASEDRGVLTEEDRHALEPGSDPHHLTGRAELVELSRLKGGHPARKHITLPQADWKREALQRHERFPERRPSVDALPRRQEASKSGLVDRLDLLSERGKARPAQPPEHVRVTPFPLAPTWAKLAPNEAPLALQAGQLRFDPLEGEREPCRRLRTRERATTAGVADEKKAKRRLAGFQEGIRKARGRHRAQRVSVTAGVLGRNQALHTAHSHPHCSALLDEGCCELLRVLARREVAAAEEHVVELIRRARRASELPLDLLERSRVQQVAQLLLPKKLLQEVTVECEGLGAALRERRVVLVHVGRHVVEEERRGEGRGPGGLHIDDIDPPRLQLPEHGAERRQVENVLQTLPEGLEYDREVGVAARHLQQCLSLESLLPQWRSLPRAAARDEKCPRGVLAKARAEERCSPELSDDELFELAGVDHEICGRRRSVGVRKCSAMPSSDQIELTSSPSVSANARPERATRARAPGPRMASGGRGASPRSRPESARRRSCGRRGSLRWPLPVPEERS